jgi:hypothetical protein
MEFVLAVIGDIREHVSLLADQAQLAAFTLHSHFKTDFIRTRRRNLDSIPRHTEADLHPLRTAEIRVAVLDTVYPYHDLDRGVGEPPLDLNAIDEKPCLLVRSSNRVPRDKDNKEGRDDTDEEPTARRVKS